MIRTFTGSNSYLLAHDLRLITNAFVQQQGDLALERIDAEETSLAAIREALISLPFLVDRKMVVLRGGANNKPFTEVVDQILASIPETTDVIFVEPKLDKRLVYFKALKKQTDFTEYGELDANGLAAWLVRSANVGQGSISSNDARYLVERVGANQQLLANELEKLIVHSPQVTRAGIDLLTELSPHSTIFQLLEAAFAGNARRALELYQEQRALKVETPQIIAMLAWQLHILAIVKVAGNRLPATIAQEAQLSPYVVQKSAAIARTIDLATLKQRISDLLEIDAKSKRTNLDVDEALQNYILRLAMKA